MYDHNDNGVNYYRAIAIDMPHLAVQFMANLELVLRFLFRVARDIMLFIQDLIRICFGGQGGQDPPRGQGQGQGQGQGRNRRAGRRAGRRGDRCRRKLFH